MIAAMSTQHPRVTVVIPCHNSLRWLPSTLNAVMDQDFDDFEVVLVDDGGDDDLAGWAATIDDQRVRVISQVNRGVAAARNAGATAAVGELIAFCDSDDLWFRSCLGALVSRYDEVSEEQSDGDPPLGLVYGWYQIADDSGAPTGRVEAHDIEGQVWESFVVGNPVGMSATLIPKVVFEGVGGFESNRDAFPIDVEDWALWIRIADAHTVAVVREVLYLHRRHDSNSSVAVDSLDSAYRHLLAQTFSSQPPRRRLLLAPATAHVEMILAWQSLNDLRDQVRARAYQRSARRHHRAVLADPEFWRLSAATAAMRFLGGSGYELVRNTAGSLRQVLGLRRS